MWAKVRCDRENFYNPPTVLSGVFEGGAREILQRYIMEIIVRAHRQFFAQNTYLSSHWSLRVNFMPFHLTISWLKGFWVRRERMDIAF